jgi:hypothetical protein
MSTTVAPYIPVTRVYESRLPEVDWDNLQPGAVFTDHMLICDFSDGEWKNAAIVPFGPFSLLPTSDTILDGITRDSLITLARGLGIPVEERPVSVDELREGLEGGWAREAFGAGTARLFRESGRSA